MRSNLLHSFCVRLLYGLYHWLTHVHKLNFPYICCHKLNTCQSIINIIEMSHTKKVQRIWTRILFGWIIWINCHTIYVRVRLCLCSCISFVVSERRKKTFILCGFVVSWCGREWSCPEIIQLLVMDMKHRVPARGTRSVNAILLSRNNDLKSKN